MQHRCGVLGSPIEHSLSPVLHRAAYRELGLDWVYDAHEVGADGLPTFLSGLDDSWRGLSLTMPLKREALPLAAAVSAVAAAAGAANTLVRRADGGWSADNTDVPGMVAALRERWEGPVDRAVILGGGATAASAVLALSSMGCAELVLAVRSADRARETMAVAERSAGSAAITVTALGEQVPADVVVATIPATAQTPELVSAYAEIPVVFEVIYDPWPTPLAASARGRSGGDGALIGGLDLLVHQAGLQFTAFTGLPAPLAVMRAAGESAIASRR